MPKHRCSKGLAAALLAGSAVVTMASSASAATPPNTCTAEQPVGGASAAPGSGSTLSAQLTIQTDSGITEATTQDTVRVGELDPGSEATGTFCSTPVSLGTVTVDSTGVATFTFRVPNVTPGLHHVVVAGFRHGQPVSISAPVVVVAAGTLPGSVGTGSVGTGSVGTGSATGRSGLPKTGSSNVLPATEVGLGLVVVGAGVLLAARRRRDQGLVTA